MNPDEMIAAARKLLDKHGLHDWKLGFTSKERCLGHYSPPGLKTIYVAFDIPRRDFRQTVLHEIAHALANEKPEEAVEQGLHPYHGKRWLKIAEQIGCTRNHLLDYEL